MKTCINENLYMKIFRKLYHRISHNTRDNNFCKTSHNFISQAEMSNLSKKRKGEEYSPGTSKKSKDVEHEDKEQHQETTEEFWEGI